MMGGISLWQTGKFFLRQVKNEPLGMRASAIAFNLFLALIPGMIALLTLIPYIPVKNLNDEFLIFMQKLMPVAAANNLDQILGDIMESRSNSLLSVGLVASIYFASSGIFSLMSALNKFDNRSYWRQKLLSIQLTLTLGLLLIVSISVFLLSEFGLQLLAINVPWGSDLWYYSVIIFQWIIMLFILFGACMICFRYAFEKDNEWKEIAPGAVIASILALLTSIIYSYYVGRWANYSKTYGSLGTIIITMLWLYFNAMVIIIGSDLNISLARAKKLPKHR